jgi:tetratricopeptide (TPR) repeat protein
LGRLNPQKLGVIAFTSVAQYRDGRKSMDEIARALGVHFILHGSVRSSGDRLRFTIELVQVSDRSQVWSSSYDRAFKDIIAIQLDVAEHVAASLTVELLGEQRASILSGSTAQSGAYVAYLKGRYYWNRRSEEDFTTALRYFSEAIKLDATFARAYVGLADVYDQFYGGLAPKVAYDKSIAAVRRALEIDGNLAEAHRSLGYWKHVYEWDFDGAEKAFRTALDLNLNHVTSHSWFALFLANMSRFEEALHHTRLALELDPASIVSNCHRGWILYLYRRYDEASELLEAAVEMNPDVPLPHYFLGLVLLQKQQYAKAITHFSKANSTSRQHPAAIAGLSSSYARLGDKRQAKKHLRSLLTLARRRYVAPHFMSLAHLALGDHTESLRCLKEACRDRSGYVTTLNCDPAFDELRIYPRFQTLLRRIGF